VPLICRLLVLGTATLSCAGPARAACTIELSPVAFDVVDTRQTSRGTGEVVVRCDTTASFEVGISSGGGSGATRRMDGPGTARLDYRLFSDAGRAVLWGDGGSLGAPVTAASDGGEPKRLTIYGEVPAQSGVEAGDYLDSLEVTLTF
jgi:spore coat protein U-like protein